MHFNRVFSSVMMGRKIIVTDPALVKSASEATSLIKGKQEGLFVRVQINEGFFKKLVGRQSNSEDAFVFGKCIGPATLIGQHASDSGLTCITEDPPYKYAEDEEGGFDWTDFVMTTLSSPEVTNDEEAFPVLKWFSRIPLAGSSVAVYGYSPTRTKDGTVYEGFMIKGL